MFVQNTVKDNILPEMIRYNEFRLLLYLFRLIG